MIFLPNLLTVGCWNIEGIYEKINGIKICKLEDETFQDMLKTFDILCLQETHTSQLENFKQVENFIAIPHCRKISKNNRYFGGMLLFIRKSLRKGVKVKQDFDVDTIEITLQKNFFGLDRNINMLFTYASPINSPYTKSRTINILEKIEANIVDGRNTYLVMGDLNGRTKKGEDFVKDSSDKYSPINVPFYTKDTELYRNNLDAHPIDEQGKIILDLCKSCSLRILNGRTTGDVNGRLTRYPNKPNENPSLIDYAICGESLMSKIFSFSVLPLTELSDHCCIATNIKINIKQQNNDCLDDDSNCGKLITNKIQITYDNNRKHIFKENLHKNKNLESLAKILNEPELNKKELDTIISKLNEIILDAAKKSFPSKRLPNKNTNKKNKPKKHKTKKWFNKECMKYRKLLRKHSRSVSSYPFDRNKLHLFTKARMEYKRVCRQAEKQHRKYLTDKLLSVGMGDPISFWNIINKMNNWGKEQTDETEHIKPATWAMTR